MRAKRSKKYRKIMSTYTLHFSFRTPYQVLCTASFLRQCHAFHMPVAKSLTNTLHGEARPYITQCSLAKAMASSQGKGRGDGKPTWLPPPLEVPMRYCKHKNAEGEEVAVLDEAECLLDLVAGQPKGNEVPRNKNHYVVAVADEEEENVGRKRRGVDVREAARRVPGTPVVYVKRSVMVLEEVSGSSERVIRGVEKAKFRDGLVGDARGMKRKRGQDDEDSESDGERRVGVGVGSRTQPAKRAKGPNPMSVRKKKVRSTGEQSGDKNGQDATEDVGEKSQKKRRRRKHGKKHTDRSDVAQESRPQSAAAQVNSAPVEAAAG